MNVAATLSLAPKLADAVLSGDEKAARILAADVKAAHAEPNAIRPWTPFNPRNAGGGNV